MYFSLNTGQKRRILFGMICIDTGRCISDIVNTEIVSNCGRFLLWCWPLPVPCEAGMDIFAAVFGTYIIHITECQRPLQSHKNCPNKTQHTPCSIKYPHGFVAFFNCDHILSSLRSPLELRSRHRCNLVVGEVILKLWIQSRDEKTTTNASRAYLS